MKKCVICLMFVFLFSGFTQAQKTKTLTGVVVDEINEGRFSGIVIKVGNKKYGVHVGTISSAAEPNSGYLAKIIGKISKGKTVQVFYTQVDSSFSIDGVNTWLEATKIVEIKSRSVQQSRADIRTIIGKVVQVMQSRAGVQVQVESSGKLYQFGLGTKNNVALDIQLTKAWESTLNKLKQGDEIIIEYSDSLNEYPGIIYGSALRVRLNQPRSRKGSRQQPSAQAGDWVTFWNAFRTAVNGRDRTALRRMIANPFQTNGDGYRTPSEWIKAIDNSNGWRGLQESAASGTMSFSNDRKGRPTRITNDRYAIFTYGRDGRWRWAEIMGD